VQSRNCLVLVNRIAHPQKLADVFQSPSFVDWLYERAALTTDQEPEMFQPVAFDSIGPVPQDTAEPRQDAMLFNL
jgi:hypothetical protein